MLSRIWTLLLALAVGAALALFHLRTTELDARVAELNEASTRAAESRLARDLSEALRAFAVDAEAQQAALSELELPAALVDSLGRSSQERAIDLPATEEALASLDDSLGLEGDALLAFDLEGRSIAARVSEPLEGIEPSELQAVSAAGEGRVSSGILVRDERAYRLVVRPVVDAGRIVGALAHARPIEASRASGAAAGSAIALFTGDTLLSFEAAEGAPDETSLEGALAELGGERPAAVGDRALALAAPLSADVSLAVAGPAPSLVTSSDPLSTPDLAGVPWPLVGGAVLLLTALGWALFAFDAARIRKGAAAAAPSAPSPLEAAPEPATPSAVAEPPVPPPAPESAPARETYDDAPTLSLGSTSLAPAEPPAEPSAERPTAPAEEERPSPLPEAPSEPPPASAAPAFAPPAPKPAPPAPAPAPAPAPPAAAAPPPFDPHGFDDDGATTVAEIPRELIAAVQEQKAMDPETAHFHEVYEQFIDLKRRLGEPTAGLTYERLEATLKKNRDAIVEKHGVATVRFTVYDKDGKAALRATPVK